MMRKQLEEITKKELIYLASVDVLKRLSEQGIDPKIIDRWNRKNAETMGCRPIPLIS